jgi:hypothetical protein
MSKLPNNEKYIMFLQPIYFKKTFFNSIYKKIRHELENKGIVLFNIDNIHNELKFMNKKIKNKYNITFDDNPFPITNKLYINLFNNQYYNDSIYVKKKLEIERNILFLLAGKLGVKNIYYDTEIIETIITKTNNSIEFNKTIINKKGSFGNEEYLNHGAPIYLKSNSITDVEKNIEDKMDIFNFNLYKNSLKLRAFVYKRFEFKMQKLEYNIETEDISDLSFAINLCFNKYGLTGLQSGYDKNISYIENIKYNLEFFTDLELKKEYGKIKIEHMDKFYSIRELYELMEDPDKAVHLIIEYVIDYANNYIYTLNDIKYNFGHNLQIYIKNNPPGTFEGVCHQFQNTAQIKKWLEINFINDNINDNIKQVDNTSNVRSITPINNIQYIELDKEVPLITPMSMTPDNLSLNIINERLLINNNYNNNNNNEYIDIVPININHS